MRILIASVTNAPLEILTQHLESVLTLELPKGVSTTLAYIADPEIPVDSLEYLERRGVHVLEPSPKPEGAMYERGEDTHNWNTGTFFWLGYEKERLLEVAKHDGYDAIFYVDSDLVLGPETLASLVYSHKDVVSAVFWTKWTSAMPELPRVWMRRPYERDGKGLTKEEFLWKLRNKELVEVGGLGACTLIRSGVFDRISWAPLPGLPEGGMWQGEDRHFCVRANRMHIALWADAWPNIEHLYTPSDAQNCVLRDLRRGGLPRVGDWVSLALEATEEPQLFGHQVHVRGRLGALKLLSDLEKAVLEMRAGESRPVRVHFPVWYPIAEYQNRTKVIMVRLLDVKAPE